MRKLAAATRLVTRAEASFGAATGWSTSV
jgi:hypothetical protein